MSRDLFNSELRQLHEDVLVLGSMTEKAVMDAMESIGPGAPDSPGSCPRRQTGGLPPLLSPAALTKRRAAPRSNILGVSKGSSSSPDEQLDQHARIEGDSATEP